MRQNLRMIGVGIIVGLCCSIGINNAMPYKMHDIEIRLENGDLTITTDGIRASSKTHFTPEKIRLAREYEGVDKYFHYLSCSSAGYVKIKWNPKEN
jgi:hypothetical protein